LRPGVIDARDRYRAAAADRRLRNTALYCKHAYYAEFPETSLTFGSVILSRVTLGSAFFVSILSTLQRTGDADLRF